MQKFAPKFIFLQNLELSKLLAVGTPKPLRLKYLRKEAFIS